MPEGELGWRGNGEHRVKDRAGRVGWRSNRGEKKGESIGERRGRGQ